jgi:hypothetical protein
MKRAITSAGSRFQIGEDVRAHGALSDGETVHNAFPDEGFTA